MLICDATDIIAWHGMDMPTAMLPIVAAVAVGMLVAGIPLSRRIARSERRKRTPFPDVADLGEIIIDEWPDDRAAAMLETWRTERARHDVHAT